MEKCMAVGQPRYPSPPRIRTRIISYPLSVSSCLSVHAGDCPSTAAPGSLVLFQADGMNAADVVRAASFLLEVESPAVARAGQVAVLLDPPVQKVTALVGAVPIDGVPASVRFLDDPLLPALD